jgi:hypothetical protein
MPEYLVSWDIDIEADTPAEAATKSLIIQRDPNSTAISFTVKDKHDNNITIIDLCDDLRDYPWQLINSWYKVNNLDTETLITLSADLVKHVSRFESFCDYVTWIKGLTKKFMLLHGDKREWADDDYWVCLEAFENECVAKLEWE